MSDWRLLLERLGTVGHRLGHRRLLHLPLRGVAAVATRLLHVAAGLLLLHHLRRVGGLHHLHRLLHRLVHRHGLRHGLRHGPEATRAQVEVAAARAAIPDADDSTVTDIAGMVAVVRGEGLLNHGVAMDVGVVRTPVSSAVPPDLLPAPGRGVTHCEGGCGSGLV